MAQDPAKLEDLRTETPELTPKIQHRRNGKNMNAFYGKDIQVVIQAELEENAKVQSLVRAYEELEETDKLLFRLAAGISQDTAANSREHQRRPNNDKDLGDRDGEIQPLVRNLMKTLLEDQPTFLNDIDQRNLMDSDYCKNNLFLHIGNFALLRKRENGKFTARNRAEKPWMGRGLSAVEPRQTESGTTAVRAGPRQKWPQHGWQHRGKQPGHH